jgi:sugar lactone lactonase YvrE
MRRLILVSLASAISLALIGPVAGAPAFPDQIPVPDGFFPEGIAVGHGHDFYVGSLLDGALYKGDLRTGDGAVLAPGADGRVVAGLSFDRRSGLVWGVGVDQGAGAILGFDGETGALVHAIAVPDAAFLNDVVAARDALYVTDSLADLLWVVPLTNRGTPAGPAAGLPLSGDFEFVSESPIPDLPPVNLNGIEVTPDGRTLIAAHTLLGVLYRIDPVSGVASEIDLGGAVVPSGDGIVLRGKTVYVVQNFLNQVAVVQLDPGFDTGALVDTITSDRFRVPATAATFGSGLYLINARFDEAFPPFLGGDPDVRLAYDVVRVQLR